MKVLLCPIDDYGVPNPNRGDVFEGVDENELLASIMIPKGGRPKIEEPEPFMLNCFEHINYYCGLRLTLTGKTLEDRTRNFFKILVEQGFAFWLN
jgi:hypothetical protein